jgi:chromatin remodeling complex protein RSC6
MSTETEVVDATVKSGPTDALKMMLVTLNEQSASIKSLTNTVRSVLKEHEKTLKELDKLRTKKVRGVKTTRSADAQPSGITKPVAISEELAKFLGYEPGTLVPRNKVTMGVSTFVKTHELYDPENKQRFLLDERPAAKQLRELLGNPSETVTYFNLQRYLKHHYIQSEKTPATPAAPKAAAAPVAVAPVAVAETPKVKKVIKVVKKKAELSED